MSFLVGVLANNRDSSIKIIVSANAWIALGAERSKYVKAAFSGSGLTVKSITAKLSVLTTSVNTEDRIKKCNILVDNEPCLVLRVVNEVDVVNTEWLWDYACTREDLPRSPPPEKYGLFIESSPLRGKNMFFTRQFQTSSVCKSLIRMCLFTFGAKKTETWDTCDVCAAEGDRPSTLGSEVAVVNAPFITSLITYYRQHPQGFSPPQLPVVESAPPWTASNVNVVFDANCKRIVTQPKRDRLEILNALHKPYRVFVTCSTEEDVPQQRDGTIVVPPEWALATYEALTKSDSVLPAPSEYPMLLNRGRRLKVAAERSEFEDFTEEEAHAVKNSLEHPPPVQPPRMAKPEAGRGDESVADVICSMSNACGGGGVAVEVKEDGWRVMLAKSGDRVSVKSKMAGKPFRNGAALLTLGALLKDLPDCWLDAEAIEGNGVHPATAFAKNGAGLTLVVFDMFLSGSPRPYAERRAHLASLLPRESGQLVMRLVQQLGEFKAGALDGLDAMCKHAVANKLEGFVLKSVNEKERLTYTRTAARLPRHVQVKLRPDHFGPLLIAEIVGVQPSGERVLCALPSLSGARKFVGYAEISGSLESSLVKFGPQTQQRQIPDYNGRAVWLASPTRAFVSFDYRTLAKPNGWVSLRFLRASVLAPSGLQADPWERWRQLAEERAAHYLCGTFDDAGFVRAVRELAWKSASRKRRADDEPENIEESDDDLSE